MRAFLRNVLRMLLPPFVWLTSPVYALVARTGIGVEGCRRRGWHPVRVHFYHPVPRYESVDPKVFDTAHAMPGVEMDTSAFAARLRVLSPHASECDWPEKAGAPGIYHWSNGNFGYTSALLLHGMLRANRIQRVLEVGGGFSSLVSMAALDANRRDGVADVAFGCVEPFPSDWLRGAISAAKFPAELFAHPAQKAAPALFEQLDENSVLFIDSSHVAKLDSDVNYLFLEMLPRLKPGVWVHVHDVYLPYEYPASHFFGPNKIFWNEQYLLQAMLAGNRDFEVVMPGYFVQRQMQDAFKEAFPSYDAGRHRPTSSFWFRRRFGPKA